MVILNCELDKEYRRHNVPRPFHQISLLPFAATLQPVRGIASESARRHRLPCFSSHLGTYSSKAGTQFAHTCGRDEDLLRSL